MKDFLQLFGDADSTSAGTLECASLAYAAGLNVKVKDGIGSYPVDEKGVTLYLFKKDSPRKSVCGAAD